MLPPTVAEGAMDCDMFCATAATTSVATLAVFMIAMLMIIALEGNDERESTYLAYRSSLHL